MRWLALALALATPAMAQDDTATARRDLAQAQAQADAARARAEKLEASAQAAIAAADKTAQDAAAIAARIQQAEAEISAHEAAIRLIEGQRADLRARLAARQRPLVELTGALQRLSRRPPVASLLRPGSLRDTVHSRALLETMLPQVQRHTAALRSDIERARQLQDQSRQAAAELKTEIANLDNRRASLGQIEAAQRLAARKANGGATQEAERALGLAEKARDLGGLVDGLEQAAALREKLALLPGPVMRPTNPAQHSAIPPQPTATAIPAPRFALPATGRLVSGFGDISRGPQARGITLSLRDGAQVVAPAAGRVAFADSFSGYGQIVIIDHTGGWTSLVTGLARLNVRVGDNLVGGSPLGVMGKSHPQLTLELRKDGKPVNPMDHLGWK
jgi:septal ring factor EnvC (AmiA/AmiB activator)